ncbi:hypothetical protein ACROYT_G022296 [Oculina patagonica]
MCWVKFFFRQIMFSNNMTDVSRLTIARHTTSTGDESRDNFLKHYTVRSDRSFNLEARNFMQKTIVELRVSDSQTVVNDSEILKRIEEFYENLYSSEYAGSQGLFDNFIENIDLPQLSEEDKNALEGELTLEECRRVLKTFSNGKSPGEDGFTIEFYDEFFDLLAPDLLESLNAAYFQGEMSISQKRGLDFKKAFDTVEWPVIDQALSRFNFGESIKRWVRTFYCNVESSVLNNGFTTKQIFLSRGVRQGCPLSPYLYILVAEILAAKIRHDKTVQGVQLFNKEIKLSQFADDTSLICKNVTSVENALAILDDFGVISGLR